MTYQLDDETMALPMADFVAAAIAWAEDLDCGDGGRLFHLVRALKSHEETKSSVSGAYDLLLEYADVTGEEVWVGNDNLMDEDGEVAFHDMWEQVRLAMGTDPVEVACSFQRRALLETHKKRVGRYEVFLGMAALLQIQVRQHPILLPVRKVGRHLGCQTKTVHAWTKWAMQDGVLIRTKEHQFRSGEKARAAEYVFGLYMWPKETRDWLGSLVKIPVRDQDLDWIEERFAVSVRR